MSKITLERVYCIYCKLECNKEHDKNYHQECQNEMDLNEKTNKCKCSLYNNFYDMERLYLRIMPISQRKICDLHQ